MDNMMGQNNLPSNVLNSKRVLLRRDRLRKNVLCLKEFLNKLRISRKNLTTFKIKKNTTNRYKNGTEIRKHPWNKPQIKSNNLHS